MTQNQEINVYLVGSATGCAVIALEAKSKAMAKRYFWLARYAWQDAWEYYYP